MLSGTCKVKVYNHTGEIQEIVELNSPEKGLYLDKMIWKEMYDYSDNSVMLVLSSEHFDKDEYIDTYEELLTEIRNG